MGDRVGREMAMSGRDKDIETERARQSHYIMWTRLVHVADPCGDGFAYEQLTSIYIKFLQFGVNYTNKDGLRAQTLVGYAGAIGNLFRLRGFCPPIDTSDPDNYGGTLKNNHRKEEDIAVQRYPLTAAIFAELGKRSEKSKSDDSEQCLIFNVTCMGRFIGPRAGEYSQTSPNKIDYHTYPSGKTVIKAFTANDFVFYDKDGNIIDILNEDSLETAIKVRITWRIQKNRQNGENKTLSAEPTCPKLCPVRAAIKIVLRARRLGQPDDLPVACYWQKKKFSYLTGTRVAALYRQAAKAVNPRISKDDLSRYSAHSLRVWACVLLDEAGCTPEFIKSRLRWKGNSFRMYLRDTGVIQDKHRDILRAASQEVIDLIASITAQTATALDPAEITDDNDPGTLDNTMGDYLDEMD